MSTPITGRTVLVHHDGSAEADNLVRFAFELTELRGQVVALAVTRVPASLPLDGLPDSIDTRALAALQRARAVAWKCGRQIESRLRRGRDLARILVVEAGWVEADAIVLNLPHRRIPWLPSLLPRTVRGVTRQATCPVFLGYFPPLKVSERSEPVNELRAIFGRAS